MTTFTDDDLKRLKASMKDYKDQELTMYVAIPDMKALLARLEAAEKVCLGIENICNAHDLHGQAEIDIKAWRKAAGK